MEQRLGNTWRMTVNERKFVETAVSSGFRVDGRDVFDYPKLSIKFGWDPYSEGCRYRIPETVSCISFLLAASSKPLKKQEETQGDDFSFEAKPGGVPKDMEVPSRATESTKSGIKSKRERTLMDAVQPKNKRKKKASTMEGS